ncbi:MAG: TrkH family potassium uptake protein, partial [Synergistaceae bacterium]|nr:TrkH family potassium uptake protein [Synergistaceae bacterium]
MKIKVVLRVLAFICVIVSVAMLPPFLLSLYDGTNDRGAFALSMSAGLIFSAILLSYTRTSGQLVMGIRDGVGVTGFSWILASLLGALPYRFSGCVESYTDAFFETMSGFTTTGATIFSEIEALPRGILLWRSLTHWIGGMGIIVLSLAVLPFLGVSGMAMYRAEVPGVTAGKVTPRLHQTA